MKSFLLPVFILSLFFACGRSSQNSSQLHANNLYPTLIGQGYDSLRMAHKQSSCLKGGHGFKKELSIQGYFHKMEDWSHFLNELNFKVPGSIYLKNDISLANFVLKARDDHLSKTYILRTRVSVGSDYIVDPQIISLNNNDSFFDYCGDQYISAVEKGGELLVAIKFYFQHTENKAEFSLHELFTTLSGIKSQIKLIPESIRKHTHVDVFYFQKGGNIDEVSQLFHSKSLVQCSLDNFGQCAILIENIWDYSKTSFVSSVKNENSDIIGFTSANYPGIKPIFEKKEVLTERRKLMTALENYQYDYDLLNSVLASKTLTAEHCDSRCLAQIMHDIRSNMQALKESIQLSFHDHAHFLKEGKIETVPLLPYEMPHIKKKFLSWLSDYNCLSMGGAISCIFYFLSLGINNLMQT